MNLYVLVRQNKDNPDDVGLCATTSNETFHYTDLNLAIKDKRNIEEIYGDEEQYCIAKLVFLD